MSTMLRSTDLRGDEVHAPAKPKTVSRVAKLEATLKRLVKDGAEEKRIAAVQTRLEKLREGEDRKARLRVERDRLEHEAVVERERERQVQHKRDADAAEAVLRERRAPVMSLRFAGHVVNVRLDSRDLAVRATAVEGVRRLAHAAMLAFQEHVQRARKAAPEPVAFEPAFGPKWVARLLDNSSELLPAARSHLVSVTVDEARD